jgi:hypothetical protein
MGDGNAEYEKTNPLVAPHRFEWFEAPARISVIKMKKKGKKTREMCVLISFACLIAFFTRDMFCCL